ncbi:MAG TPA: transglutaminase family protein [Abditibacteriaceae bacterium]|jgi:transglutaminase-like putative cysteine protease
MKLQVSAHAVYNMPQQVTGLLQIEVANLPMQHVLHEELSFSPPTETEFFIDIFGNRNRRFCAPPGHFEMSYTAQVDLTESLAPPKGTAEVDVADIPPEVLVLTLPSRYCESDRLAKVAADLFGDVPRGASRVLTICDWIRSKITYEYGHTTSSTGAFDMVTERIGVCRDFSHLAIAFCRALNIPARYAAGYCLELDPPDFHAYFQAYLAPPPGFDDLPGWWYPFDATYERVRHGLINISVGRDAVDTSMMTFFGSAQLVEQTVSVEETEASI